MILFDKRSEVYEVRGQLKINVLAVSNNILSLCQIVLTFFGKHNIKHRHSLFFARLVALQILVRRNPKSGVSKRPLLAVLSEVGEKYSVNAHILKCYNV